jgi:hypothetical protein
MAMAATLRTVVGRVTEINLGNRIIGIRSADGELFYIDYLSIFSQIHKEDPRLSKAYDTFCVDRIAQMCSSKALYAMKHDLDVKVWGHFRPASDYDVDKRWSAVKPEWVGGYWEMPYMDGHKLARDKYHNCHLMTIENNAKENPLGYRPNSRSNLVICGIDDDEFPSMNIDDNTLCRNALFYTVIGRITGFDGRSMIAQIKPEKTFHRQVTGERKPVPNKPGVTLPVDVKNVSVKNFEGNIYFDLSNVQKTNPNIGTADYTLSQIDFQLQCALLKGSKVTVLR